MSAGLFLTYCTAAWAVGCLIAGIAERLFWRS
jgi:hypothetical protein